MRTRSDGDPSDAERRHRRARWRRHEPRRDRDERVQQVERQHVARVAEQPSQQRLRARRPNDQRRVLDAAARRPLTEFLHVVSLNAAFTGRQPIFTVSLWRLWRVASSLESCSSKTLRPSPSTQPEPPRIAAIPEPLPYRIKNKLLGSPLHTERLEHETLGKPTALAVFASDNLSSSAYATEEILRVLLPWMGLAAFSLVTPITIALLVVLGFLILSYRQTIKAYPSAGGAYIVTRDNFGLLPAQVAGVALLTDYVLTVAVSVAAGSDALASAIEPVAPVQALDRDRIRGADRLWQPPRDEGIGQAVRCAHVPLHPQHGLAARHRCVPAVRHAPCRRDQPTPRGWCRSAPITAPAS